MTATAPKAPEFHVRLAPSKAERWLHCPGSITAEAPFPDTTSEYAEEGTRAHALASALLERGWDTDRATMAIEEGPRFSDEDLAAIQLYLDTVRGIWMLCDVTWIEQKVLFPDHYHMPEPMGGTTDAGGHGGGVLRICDLKFGKGVVVEVEDNEQEMYYAAAVFANLPKPVQDTIQEVELTIVQPRAYHDDGPVRVWTCSRTHLVDFIALRLRPGAEATQKPDAPRAAGHWCKFCKAKRQCATFREAAFEQMPFAFEDLPTTSTMLVPATTEADARTIATMTPEQAGAVWGKLPLLREWIEAFEGFILAELQAGRAIPGVGLKRAKSHRQWMDEEMVADFYDHAPSIYTEPKLLSPAQMEKLAKKHGMEFPEHLVTKPEGGLTLCPADDKGALASPPTVASHFQFEELP